MTVVADAANGRDAITQFRTHRPDVTLMDIQMPEMNGLDALIAIRSEFPDAKLIVSTTYEGDVHILRALKAGAQGYLLKNTLHSDLLQTIRAVHAAGEVSHPKSRSGLPAWTDQALTPAEVVVLRLIAEGNADKEIANQLSITEDTVKGRVKSILAKLDANDRTHAAIIGLGAASSSYGSLLRGSPKGSNPLPPGVVPVARRRRIIVSRYVVRRLYSTFAEGWPGIGLLLMRLVVGAVILWHVGPDCGAVHRCTGVSAMRSWLLGPPTHRGIMDASRWRDGRRRRDRGILGPTNLPRAAFSPQPLPARWRCSDPAGCRSMPGCSDGSASTRSCTKSSSSVN